MPPKKCRGRRIAACAGAVTVLGYAAAMAGLSRYGRAEEARPADFIVIFGAKVFPGGRAGPVLRNRTRHAYNLWKRGLAPYIVCTGGVGENPPAEGEVEAGLLRSWGVPAGAIVIENRSTSTRENAQFISEIWKQPGHRAIAVTDPYHMWRACRQLRRVGFTAYPSPALENWESLPLHTRLYLTAREVPLVVRELVLP